MFYVSNMIEIEWPSECCETMLGAWICTLRLYYLEFGFPARDLDYAQDLFCTEKDSTDNVLHCCCSDLRDYVDSNAL
jgi:hypothetical protein